MPRSVFLNCAALKSDVHEIPSSWKLCTVEEVEDLKTLIKIIPLWSTGIFVATPIAILSNLVVLQALTMDRHIGVRFKIPAGSFLVFNLLATAISIAFVDHLLLPIWKKLTNNPLTLLQRIGTGHVINIIGIVSSALVEVKRLSMARTNHLVGDDPNTVVPMSALWLVLPLFIIGLGEGFHVPGQVALYYQEFPVSLRSTSTAMISALIGIGFYLSSAVTGVISNRTTWLPDNINEGRVDNVYWMLTAVGVVNFGYYLVCAVSFKHEVIEDLIDLSESSM